VHSFNYLDHAASAFLVVDADSLEILYANPMASANHGLQVGMQLESIDLDLHVNRMRRLLGEGREFRQLIGAGESELDIDRAEELRAVSIEAGDRHEILVQVVDLSAVGERIAIYESYATLAEQTRGQLQRQLASFPEENPNPVLRASLEGEITYANPGAQALATEMGLPSVIDLLSEEHESLVTELRDQLGASQTVEHKVGDRSFKWTYHRVLDGAAVHLYGAETTDIHTSEQQRRHAEAQLNRSQRLQALGQLAGGIAHDFNNILTAISGFAELSKEGLPDAEDHLDNLEQIILAADRAKNITAQILAFSRGEETDTEPVVLGTLVTEALNMLQASIPKSVVIRKDITQVLGTSAFILGDSNKLHQIVINLVTNAAQAIPDTGGEVGVTVRLSKNPGQKEMVELIVADTGKGMDRKTAERIFDPYFTTKSQGRGTGLGLSVVHGIVKSHGGKIKVQSAQGHGTTFTLRFPRAEVSEIKPEHTTPRPDTPARKLRVMVIDDEPALVKLMKRMLGRAQHEVQGYTVAQEAIEAFQEKSSMFDVVITDQSMPGITGISLTGEFLKIRPDIPVIICSGYDEALSLERVKEGGATMLVRKPIHWPNLLDTMQTVCCTEFKA
jgi:signal transduction histidine kinase